MLQSEMQRKGIKNSSTIMNQPPNLPHCKKEARKRGEKQKGGEELGKRKGQGMKGLERVRGKGKWRWR